ncbi:uncharacterized protein LOC134460012 [Engraulis encrasicolus]|uniref:uncharacterized protein LOC134460012 n=1 Tax=Engraulis encrasicolus TaxID=184585 RepID=UPI002FD00F7B
MEQLEEERQSSLLIPNQTRPNSEERDKQNIEEAERPMEVAKCSKGVMNQSMEERNLSLEEVAWPLELSAKQDTVEAKRSTEDSKHFTKCTAVVKGFTEAAKCTAVVKKEPTTEPKLSQEERFYTAFAKWAKTSSEVVKSTGKTRQSKTRQFYAEFAKWVTLYTEAAKGSKEAKRNMEDVMWTPGEVRESSELRAKQNIAEARSSTCGTKPYTGEKENMSTAEAKRSTKVAKESTENARGSKEEAKLPAEVLRPSRVVVKVSTSCLKRSVEELTSGEEMRQCPEQSAKRSKVDAEGSPDKKANRFTTFVNLCIEQAKQSTEVSKQSAEELNLSSEVAKWSMEEVTQSLEEVRQSPEQSPRTAPKQNGEDARWSSERSQSYTEGKGKWTIIEERWSMKGARSYTDKKAKWPAEEVRESPEQSSGSAKQNGEDARRYSRGSPLYSKEKAKWTPAEANRSVKVVKRSTEESKRPMVEAKRSTGEEEAKLSMEESKRPMVEAKRSKGEEAKRSKVDAKQSKGEEAKRYRDETRWVAQTGLKGALATWTPRPKDLQMKKGPFPFDSKKVWIIGDALMLAPHENNKAVRLVAGGIKWKPYWKPLADVTLAKVVEQLLERECCWPIPDMLIVHLGSSCDIPHGDLEQTLQRIQEHLLMIHRVFPQSLLVWSDILPRPCTQETAPGHKPTDSTDLAGSLHEVNQKLYTMVKKLGGTTISHENIHPIHCDCDGRTLSDDGARLFHRNIVKFVDAWKWDNSPRRRAKPLPKPKRPAGHGVTGTGCQRAAQVVWICGDGFIARARASALSLGIPLGHGTDTFQVVWKEVPQMMKKRFTPFLLKSEDKVIRPPDMVILYLSDCEVRRRMAELVSNIRREVTLLHRIFPECLVVWSEVLPMLLPDFTVAADINPRLHALVKELGGKVITHDNVESFYNAKGQTRALTQRVIERANLNILKFVTNNTQLKR